MIQDISSIKLREKNSFDIYVGTAKHCKGLGNLSLLIEHNTPFPHHFEKIFLGKAKQQLLFRLYEGSRHKLWRDECTEIYSVVLKRDTLHMKGVKIRLVTDIDDNGLMSHKFFWCDNGKAIEIEEYHGRALGHCANEVVDGIATGIPIPIPIPPPRQFPRSHS